MKKVLITALTALIACPIFAADKTIDTHNSTETLIELTSPYSFTDTVSRLKQKISEKKLKLFAVLDHSEAAKEAGLMMPPTQVIVFGNPTVGTPLMLDSPALALQLPFKVLIAENAKGEVTVSYFTADFLTRSVGAKEATEKLKGIETLIRTTINK
ncbi:DUF302 domain-containing protein [Rodentibacter caecimuris]|uniref:DUF302 domain-containing protein n=1 Tax=Rodentibacter caecimuris TaxID=1796644 RepID=A0ABX3KYA2_9PAST|nr:hypothetical protein BKG89_03410 [Rodentibacter heylii]